MKDSFIKYTDANGETEEYATVHAFEHYFGMKYDKALKILQSQPDYVGQINVSEIKGKMGVIPKKSFERLKYLHKQNELEYGDDPKTEAEETKKYDQTADNKILDWKDFLKNHKVRTSNVEDVIDALSNIIESKDADIDYLKNLNKNTVIRKVVDPFSGKVGYYTDKTGKNYQDYQNWLKSNPNNKPQKP